MSTDPRGELLVLGQPYHPGRTHWPTRAEYNFRAGAHELRIFMPAISPRELAGFRNGRMDFALYIEQSMLVLCWKIEGAMAWSDNTYSIHLVDEAERALPSGSAGHALLQAIVVEANTGRVAALRVCTFSPDFTAALEGAILEQSRRLFDREDWDRRGAALYARFRDSETLARAAQHRCRGGA